MKRLLVVMVAGLSLSAFAATEDSATSHFGIQAGANVSNANAAPTTQATNRTGLSAGIALESPLVPGLVYLQPELNFIQKGSTSSLLGLKATNTLNYIELPVQAKVKFNLGGVKPYLLAGPKVAYLVSASSDAAGVSVSRSDFNSWDVGVTFGGGLGFAVSETTEAFLTARYSAGLTDVRSGSDYKNTGVQLMGGLLF